MYVCECECGCVALAGLKLTESHQYSAVVLGLKECAPMPGHHLILKCEFWGLILGRQDYRAGTSTRLTISLALRFSFNGLF